MTYRCQFSFQATISEINGVIYNLSIFDIHFQLKKNDCVNTLKIDKEIRCT